MMNLIPATARHVLRACRAAFGWLALVMLMTSAHAYDAPNGWRVYGDNNGSTFAPVRMNPGEKLEIWVSSVQYDAPRGVSLQNLLPQIRQQAGAMEGKCQPPEESDGSATQDCEASDSALQYMLLPSRAGQGKVQLLRIRVVGNEEALARYSDGIRQTMQIVMAGQPQAQPQTEPRNDGRTSAQTTQPTRPAQPAQQERERIAQAIRTSPGQGVRDGDIDTVFVTWREVKNGGETVSRVVHTSWLLLKDGTGYQITMPPDELNVKMSRELEPTRWVKWRKPWLGNDYEIRGPNDKDWIRLKGYVAQPARLDERLNGVYERIEYYGNRGTGISTSTYTWYFSGDGTYKTAYHGERRFFGWGTNFSSTSSTFSDWTGTRSTSASVQPASTFGNQSGVGTYANRQVNDGSDRRGRYRFKGWVLEVDRDDGQTDRYFFTFRDGKRATLDLNSNWFDVKRK